MEIDISCAPTRKLQVAVTDRQYEFLRDESLRTGLSMAEMIRRSIDAVYRPYARQRADGVSLRVSLLRDPDAAVVGREFVRRGRRSRRG
jgi:hypothetical protein